jgi:hypothetical protein
MDTCLVTAPTATAFRDAEELNNEAVRSMASEPQVGILSLAAALEAIGETPGIVDLNRAYLDYTAHAGGADAGGFAEAILARTWPTRKTEAKIQIRKMLAELDIPFESRDER